MLLSLAPPPPLQPRRRSAAAPRAAAAPEPARNGAAIPPDELLWVLERRGEGCATRPVRAIVTRRAAADRARAAAAQLGGGDLPARVGAAARGARDARGGSQQARALRGPAFCPQSAFLSARRSVQVLLRQAGLSEAAVTDVVARATAWRVRARRCG
jgi:hypothetical protein